VSAPVLVQKFGGTSVATVERRQQVVDAVRRARADGHAVAIVVSAMGRRGDPYATDTLLDLLRADGGPVDPRDYTLAFVTGEMIATAVMSQALKRAGIPAVGLTGAQARIYTDGHPTEAEIVEIDASRVRSHLERGEVPVVTGGQGISRDSFDYSTLGRGASDTSGVALGVALGASKVEIFTDVEGVAVTDPRIISDARWLTQVSYGRMYEMARFGAKVLHPRAVMTGWTGRTPIVVRSTFSTSPGTRIGEGEDDLPIVGITMLSPMETVAVPATAPAPGVRERWERQRVVMSLRDAASGTTMVGVSADRAGDLDAALDEAGIQAIRRLGPRAWVSLVGDTQALQQRLARTLRCLEKEGIETAAYEQTDRRFTCVIDADRLERAVQVLYQDTFG
jgi:aspartate kinase